MKGRASLILPHGVGLQIFVAVLQRVVSASVTVDKQLISSIGRGILVFAAVDKDDTRKEVEAMAAKVLKLKMWPDEAGATVCLLIIYHPMTQS